MDVYETSIFDLNDDCLREVFQLLYIDELTVVADVCTRFRRIAENCAHSELEHFEMNYWSPNYAYTMLRIFGEAIKRVAVDGKAPRKNRTKFQKRLIGLVNLHCVGESIEICLKDFDITDEIANLMQPLLSRVRKIHLKDCQWGEVFLKNLPFWSPKLREFECEWRDSKYEDQYFDSLHQRFSMLESISFLRTRNLRNSDIQEFLNQNPQLKRIELIDCNNVDAVSFNRSPSM